MLDAGVVLVHLSSQLALQPLGRLQVQQEPLLLLELQVQALPGGEGGLVKVPGSIPKVLRQHDSGFPTLISGLEIRIF